VAFLCQKDNKFKMDSKHFRHATPQQINNFNLNKRQKIQKTAEKR